MAKAKVRPTKGAAKARPLLVDEVFVLCGGSRGLTVSLIDAVNREWEKGQRDITGRSWSSS